jgi:integrase
MTLKMPQADVRVEATSENTNDERERERGAESSGEIKGGGTWRVFAINDGGKPRHVLIVNVRPGHRAKRRLPVGPHTATADLRARFAKGMAPEVMREELAALDAPKEKLVPTRMTFRDVGTLWTSGDLAKRYPDHVKEKRSGHNDASRLKHLYDTIGDVAIDDPNWVDHAERAMGKLPKSCKTPGARRQYAQLIRRVLGLAAYPLRLIPAVPLPPGFLPKLGGRKADQWLRPSEDARLMAATRIPLVRRLLWGVLAREGMRVAIEALPLRWRDVDLEIGSITIPDSKGGESRAWAGDPGVIRALKAYRKLLGDPEPNSRIFVDENGVSLDGVNHADAFRDDLKIAKVDRPELFERTKNRLAIRAHDLRATFITISLANGKTESWVQDRTGHTSSVMINRYRRAARTAAELGLGTLAPLDEAIPELRPKKAPEPPPSPKRNAEDDPGSGDVPPSVASSSEVREGSRDTAANADSGYPKEDCELPDTQSRVLDPLIGVRIPAPEPCRPEKRGLPSIGWANRWAKPAPEAARGRARRQLRRSPPRL